jgi:hypothetical protein
MEPHEDSFLIKPYEGNKDLIKPYEGDQDLIKLYNNDQNVINQEGGLKYPKPEDPDFYKKIAEIYNRFKIGTVKTTMKEICYPKKWKFQMSQKFLAEYINPRTPYLGILVYHKIGSGKTCTAINIAEKWKKLRKIIVVVPASLIINFRNELRSLCAGNTYLTETEREKLKKLSTSSREYHEIIKTSDARIDEYYTIMSYNKFVENAENRKLNLRNSILIVDEIQNMVSEEGKYYQVLYDTIKRSPKDLRVVLLSATPIFDKPIEIALTLNLLKRNVEPLPIENEFGKTFIEVIKRKNRNGDEVTTDIQTKNMDYFKSLIKGYVSYFRGAPPHTFPVRRNHLVRCIMEDFQYLSYLTSLTEEYKENKKLVRRAFSSGDIIDLPNNFFIGTRIISNIAFPNKYTKKKGYESFTKNAINNLEKLKKYSIKFYKILKRIKRSRGPVFVYSNFKEYDGIKSFAKVLRHQGYKDYREAGAGRNRYAIWSGDEKFEYKEEIRNLFNLEENTTGTRLKVLIGSPAAKEGLSLFRTRQVHIMEPYWNFQRIEQVIGRAFRFCSHKDLPLEDRVVDVYLYLATHPEIKETVDQYIYRLAQKKSNIIKDFEMALKETAIDCRLFKNANVYKGEEDLQCE